MRGGGGRIRQGAGATRCSLAYVLSDVTNRKVRVVEQCSAAARCSVSVGGPCFKVKMYHSVQCKA